MENKKSETNDLVEKPMEPFKILIIEDDEGLLLLVQKTLQRTGFHADGVSNGAKAIAFIVENSPELLLLDYKLPDMTAHQIIKILKERESAVPFIVMTGQGDEKLAVNMMKLGARDYLVKSTDFLDLLPIVVKQVIDRLNIEKEFVEAENKIRMSEEKLSQIIQGSPIPTFVIDMNHIVTHWNKACESLANIPSNEIVGTQNQWMPFYPKKRKVLADLIVDNASKKEMSQYYGNRYRESKIIKGAYEAEDLFYSLSEKGRWLFFAASPLRDCDGKVIGAIEILQETTERKLLEDRLIRSERLAATGQLAASIAHEVNSPLQGIVSLLQTIKETHKQDDRLLENLNLVNSGFIRIQDIIKKLLDLNRPRKEIKQPTNINDVIEDTVALLTSHLKSKKVKVDLHLSSKIPTITASPKQLGSVFMNLIGNAIEAINDSSKSSGSRKIIESTYGKITINSNLRQNGIIIEITDTGPGIPREAMKHIFDPFYTRKKEMGLGIGLSLCHSIIEEHNGSIAARNSLEGGAIFSITLPVC
jgi:two-component system, sporulation sensor kinase E